jgi:3-isopropylmalate/(R)-2-methylmalate dehydratase small subunit
MIEGKVWKYGDNVNTDVIFPGKYTYTVTDPAEMASHAMEDLDPEFAMNVKPGDIVVGGANFGCGSSREQAAFCLKAAGVGAVIAKSFARLYFRNCINAGLPAFVQPELVDAVSAGDVIKVDISSGKIIAGSEYPFPEFPEEVKAILESGGLVEWVKSQAG